MLHINNNNNQPSDELHDHLDETGNVIESDQKYDNQIPDSDNDSIDFNAAFTHTFNTIYEHDKNIMFKLVNNIETIKTISDIPNSAFINLQPLSNLELDIGLNQTESFAILCISKKFGQVGNRTRCWITDDIDFEQYVNKIRLDNLQYTGATTSLDLNELWNLNLYQEQAIDTLAGMVLQFNDTIYINNTNMQIISGNISLKRYLTVKQHLLKNITFVQTNNICHQRILHKCTCNMNLPSQVSGALNITNQLEIKQLMCYMHNKTFHLNNNTKHENYFDDFELNEIYADWFASFISIFESINKINNLADLCNQYSSRHLPSKYCKPHDPDVATDYVLPHPEIPQKDQVKRNKLIYNYTNARAIEATITMLSNQIIEIIEKHNKIIARLLNKNSNSMIKALHICKLIQLTNTYLVNAKIMFKNLINLYYKTNKHSRQNKLYKIIANKIYRINKQSPFIHSINDLRKLTGITFHSSKLKIQKHLKKTLNNQHLSIPVSILYELTEKQHITPKEFFRRHELNQANKLVVPKIKYLPRLNINDELTQSINHLNSIIDNNMRDENNHKEPQSQQLQHNINNNTNSESNEQKDLTIEPTINKQKPSKTSIAREYVRKKDISNKLHERKNTQVFDKSMLDEDDSDLDSSSNQPILSTHPSTKKTIDILNILDTGTIPSADQIKIPLKYKQNSNNDNISQDSELAMINDTEHRILARKRTRLQLNRGVTLKITREQFKQKTNLVVEKNKNKPLTTIEPSITTQVPDNPELNINRNQNTTIVNRPSLFDLAQS